MNRFIALILFLICTSAQAQYTCQDLPELRRTLADLTRDCGTLPRNDGQCVAQVNSSKFPGQTVTEAINLCIRGGWSENTCAGHVTCEGMRRICYAQVNSSKFPGVNSHEAMDVCRKAGWSPNACAQQLDCQGFPRLCTAQVNSSKFPGTTTDEAIEVCKIAGWSDSTCAQRVTCQ